MTTFEEARQDERAVLRAFRVPRADARRVLRSLEEAQRAWPTPQRAGRIAALRAHVGEAVIA
jgi:hypothetical protein